MGRDPMKLNTSNLPLEAYEFIRKWFTLASLAASFVLFIINAPFGRFVPTGSPASRHPVGWFNSKSFLVDGIRSWIVMELVAPITFIYGLVKSPMSFYKVPLPDPFSPQGMLVVLFLVHYLNRAVINPLRTPSRSKAHLIVPIAGVAFNVANGYILGSFFSSPYARIYLGGQYAFDRPTFRIGVTLWTIGFIGNIVHDEILLDIRKKAQARKAKDAGGTPDSQSKATTETGQKEPKKEESLPGEYYGIPTGLLYEYISYPNYLCEWIEWFGFALAASPFPLPIDFDAVAASPTIIGSAKIIGHAISSTFVPLLSPWAWKEIIQSPAYAFAPMLGPPWIFLINEIMVMIPRAIKGHLWYKEQFGESYPKNRKAIIPFVL